MDNIQFWIWLAVIVISLIFKANKKKTGQEQPHSETDNKPEGKPISFEDLLREIQASKAPAQPKPRPVVQPKMVEYVDYDDDLEEEIKPLEKTSYRNDDEIYATYEKAKSEAFNRASLEETMRIEDTVVSYEKFKRYNRDKNKAVTVDYAREFRNPSSFKRAFIMSEILSKRF